MALHYQGYEPPHVCADTNESEFLAKQDLLNDTTATIVCEKCQIRLGSNQTGHPRLVTSTGCLSGHSYEGGKDVSMKTEWNLVCDNNGIAELVQTMFSVGMTLSSIVVCPLPDRFGRKRVIIFLSVISTVFELTMTFSPSIYVAIAIRFLSGIAMQNIAPIAYVLATELLVTKHRETFVMLSLLVWAFFAITLGGVSFALSSYSWRVLQLVASLTGLLPLVFVYIIDESLPWLFAKGRHAHALEIIKRACSRNGSNFELAERAYHECVLRLRRVQESQDHETPESATTAVYGFLDIVRHRRLLITSLILCLAMFTLTYFGMYLTSATFHVNRFFMFIILSGLEIPSSVAFFGLLSYMGRRTLVLVSLSIAAICLLVSTCLVGIGSSASVHVSNSSAAFFILGKFSIDVAYCCVSCFLIEHYPTTLRSIGNGICFSVGRIGGMVAPFLYPLFVLVNWAHGTILVITCFITVSLYTMVPETKGRELPTRLESNDTTRNTRKKSLEKSIDGIVAKE